MVGVRGGLDDAENDSLILLAGNCQLALREHVERHDQRDHNRPENKDPGPVLPEVFRPACVNRCCAPALNWRLMMPAKPFCCVSRSATVSIPSSEKASAYHNSETITAPASVKRRTPGTEHPSQAALNPNRRIHRSQRDCHCDNRTDQLAGCIHRRPYRRLSHVNMPLDVLHHHDSVVHN